MKKYETMEPKVEQGEAKLSRDDSDAIKHRKFIKLMQYLNEYKQNICYEGSCLINTNMPRNFDEKENDYLEHEKQEAYSAARLFPVETSGPKKGRYVPQKDSRGNTIVDPTENVKRDPFFLDYQLYL